MICFKQIQNRVIRMSYVSRRGKRPVANSSKSSHSHIINDKIVDKYLDQCNFPKTEDEVDLLSHKVIDFNALENSKIKNVSVTAPLKSLMVRMVVSVVPLVPEVPYPKADSFVLSLTNSR